MATIDPTDHTRLATLDPTGRLFNEDLAPAKERRWSAYSMFALWMSDAHNIGDYTFAAGLFLLGLSAWQVTLGILLGILVIFAGCTLMGFIGYSTGVPYPVVSRMSFGLFGANFPALVRAVVAIGWYGIQTYLASVAIAVLLLRLDPSLGALQHSQFLGLDTLSWICFLALWLIQLIVLAAGMDIVRLFQDWAGPIIWVLMLVMAGWLLVQAHGHISFTSSPKPLSVNQQIYLIFASAGFTIGVLATLMLNFCDFSRFAPSRRAVVIGNFFGLPINWTAFCLTSVVVSAGSLAVYGKAFLDPTELLAQVPNTFVLIVGVFMFCVATIGVNIVANFVSPAYDLANVWPKWITFRRGGIIAAVVSVVVMPWKLYSTPAVINYFLGALGAFLGPFFGVMMVDYWLIKKQHINVVDLYRPSPDSQFWYHNGINTKAFAAWIPGAVVAAVIALVPTFSVAAPFAWFIGVAISGSVYYALMRQAVVPVAALDQALSMQHLQAELGGEG